jgi:hypothetical protein
MFKIKLNNCLYYINILTALFERGYLHFLLLTWRDGIYLFRINLKIKNIIIKVKNKIINKLSDKNFTILFSD